jgi:ubiquinone/menaquinone biosynthesis C-methylase UbiE
MINKKNFTALEAQLEAQKIAFAPVIFQVVRTMRQFGILKMLGEHKEGLTLEEIAEKSNIDAYGIQVLLESALSAYVIHEEKSVYTLSKVGYFLENDKMIQVNMDFNHYVNYKGFYDLDKSIKEKKPMGLQVFGNWDTIYPHLSILPDDAKKAWFDFDHYYSDSAFDDAIETLKTFHPKNILDIGGNTGKFSIRFASKSTNTNLTILDLPGQINVAQKNIKKNGFEDRISFYPLDILDHNNNIPTGFDIIWLSQFIDCFSEEDAIKILSRIKKSMDKNSRLCILEPLWDKQRFEASSFVIINTSPYFTTMANGCSKMFKSSDLESYIKKAGLTIETSYDNLGFSHTLIKCKI